MQQLTASNLVRELNRLNKDNAYNYLDSSNPGLIKIERVQLPEGPIIIKRWKPESGETEHTGKSASISKEQIWRLANALVPDQPINVDRLFAGSYNTRSVLEALLVHTPQFSYCYPGRIQMTGGNPTIKNGHKHIIWTPNDTHSLGVTRLVDTDIVISEAASVDTYDALKVMNPSGIGEISGIDADIKRTHALMQIALYNIGKQLDYRTWVAQNDKGIIYNGKRIIEYEGIIHSLKNEPLLKSHADAIKAALLIDCIWFKNGKLMPAVIEVEHSTGVTSGLSRMKNFQDLFPPFPTSYIIVAPDEDRAKVIQEANKVQFKSLNTKYLPYSAVNELYSLCKRRNIKGINQEFLDSFMEQVVAA